MVSITPILLTGSTGFVGSAIACHCEAAGLSIRKTDRASFANQSGYVPADILDPTSLQIAMKGMTCVIHAAGLAHQFGKRQVTVPFTAVNVQGTENVAQAAVGAGVQHFILISSVSVYGTHTTRACTETTPCQPEGIYAESKYQAEQRAIVIAQATGMGLTILRLATVYGEGDPGNVVRLIRAIDRGRFMWIGTGSNSKSLIHRDDVARACVAVATHAHQGIAIYNITAPPCTMREIVEEIAQGLGQRLPRWHIPALPLLRFAELAKNYSGQQRHMGQIYEVIRKWLADDVYDGSAFNEAFGFQTQVRLAEGLQREIAWYQERKTFKRLNV